MHGRGRRGRPDVPDLIDPHGDTNYAVFNRIFVACPVEAAQLLAATHLGYPQSRQPADKGKLKLYSLDKLVSRFFQLSVQWAG